MSRKAACLALACLFIPTSAHAAGQVTLKSLLRQMTDLSLLAEFPDPPYVAKQFSSYERVSETPKDHNHWFANHDRGFMLYDGVVRQETPYFKGGPMQGRGPDGAFPAGIKVGIARNRKPVGDYVWAYSTAPDGGPIGGKIPQGYIPKSAIQMDPQGHVLAEMDGPGCVTRIWSANPDEAGNIRIYLDNSDKPVIDAPMTELLGGKWRVETAGKKWTPFPDPIACERSRGWNLYFPIAYAKHCKITVTKPDVYYHIDYRAYPPGTEVETFSLSQLSAIRLELAELSKSLQRQRGPGPGAFSPAGSRRVRPAKIEPGKRSEPLTLTGSRAVDYLRISVKGYRDIAAALRGLVLVARFDDAEKAQIWCPLADFAAAGTGSHPSASLPLELVTAWDENRKPFLGLFSNWWMPFRNSAEFRIHNLGPEPLVVAMFASHQPFTWSDRSMHFHAKWRTQKMNTRPFRDWTYCDLKGKGVFVGDVLSVMNPVAPWWGEGDEKIYVDGEPFPSWFGTGTEDYYGYAWCDPKPFQHAYHNQTRCDGPGNKGHTSVNRFHILDAIPFTKSFRFDMEVWHWTPNIDVTYAATSYWYARPSAADDFKEADAATLRHIPSVPPPFKVKGAVEGEALKVVEKSSGFPTEPQDMGIFADGKWSGERHLWGRPPKKGEWADLELPVPADGTYRVVVYLTKARDYGIVQFSLDGQPLGKPIDCFHANSVVSTGPAELGTAELKKGTAKLRVAVVGTNPKSVGLHYMWGLDCVKLER